MKHKIGKQYILGKGVRQKIVTLLFDFGSICRIKTETDKVYHVKSQDLVREATLKEIMVADKYGYIPNPYPPHFHEMLHLGGFYFEAKLSEEYMKKLYECDPPSFVQGDSFNEKET